MKDVRFVLLFFLLSMAVSAAPKERVQTTKDFEAVTLKGKKIKLSDFRGKVVLLDFWASWCAPCRKEFPFLIDLYNRHKKQDFVVLGVNVDERSADMKKFLNRLTARVPFPVIPDRKGVIPKLFKIEAMPTTFLIDRQGKIRYVHKGFKKEDKSTCETEVQALLTETQP